jgi:hypothetical protein
MGIWGRRKRCVEADRVVTPIFWIVELDREGKFALRFVEAYRHNSSQGPLFLSLSICVCVLLNSRYPELQLLNLFLQSFCIDHSVRLRSNTVYPSE